MNSHWCKIRLFALTIAGALLLGFADRAAAELVTLINPSFESPALADGVLENDGPGPGFSFDPPGWSLGPNAGAQGYGTLNPSGIFNNDAGNNTPVGGDGAQHYLIYQASPGQGVTLYQNVTDTLTSNKVYTLTLAIGRQINGDAVNWGFSLMTQNQSFTGGYGNFPYLARLTGTRDDLISGQFVDKSVTFTTTGSTPDLGQPLRVTFWSEGASGGNRISFDNVRLDVANVVVPEPSTALLCGSGLAILAWWRRRRR